MSKGGDLKPLLRYCDMPEGVEQEVTFAQEHVGSEVMLSFYNMVSEQGSGLG